MGRPWFVLLAGIAACATGSSGTDDDTPAIDASRDDVDGPSQPIDGPPDPPPDAEVAPDADTTPTAVTLNQSTASNIVSPNTVVCGSGNPIQYTLENSFYRAFRLVDHGVSGQFTATRVDLGIEQAETVANSQTIQVVLHTVSGTFPSGALTQLHTQNVVINDVVGTLMPITLSSPVVVPAGSTLVLEIHAPAHSAANNYFFPGSNTAPENGPSYIKATACGVNTPTTFAAVPGGPYDVKLVMSVVGTTP